MVKNKSKLAIKLFIIVWVVLAVHIALKLTFNYWQPYVISNDKLQTISDFIDSHSVIKIGLNGLWYLINGTLVILCCIKRWWFKTKKQIIIVYSVFTICYILNNALLLNNITPIITTILLPLLLDYKKWKYILLTFIFGNIFLALSLWLEGFVTADNMNYAVRMFLQFDYYIMLILNYFVFNLFRKEKT